MLCTMIEDDIVQENGEEEQIQASSRFYNEPNKKYISQKPPELGEDHVDMVIDQHRGGWTETGVTSLRSAAGAPGDLLTNILDRGAYSGNRPWVVDAQLA